MKIIIFLMSIFLALTKLSFAQSKEEVSLFSKKAKNLEISLTVDKAVNAMLSTRQYARASANNYIKQAEESAKDLRKEKAENSASYDGTFKAVWASDTLLSLLGEHWSFSGGAHGSTTYQSQLFDLTSKRIVFLSEILEGLEKPTPASRKLFDFVATSIARQKIKNEREEAKNTMPITNADIAKHIKQDEYLTSDKMTKDWFINYVFITPETEKEFQKTPTKTPVSAIRLLYAQYEMGAYAEGIFEVNLPVSLFKDLLKPAWTHYFKI